MKNYVYVRVDGNGIITCFDNDEQVYTFTIHNVTDDEHEMLDNATSEDLRQFMNKQFV